jgi:hypothetical protein
MERWKNSGGSGQSTNAAWLYQVQNLPEAVAPPFAEPDTVRIKPDPPAISVSTAIFYNSWIWRIKRNPSKEYRIACLYIPDYAYTYGKDTGWWTYEYINNDHYGYSYGNFINLTPPPRNLGN